MNEIKNLIDSAAILDCSVTELSQDLNALQVLDEAMESDGFQSEERFNEWAAVNFSRRFPIYLNTFRVIYKDLSRVVSEIQSTVDLMYDAAKAQKESCHDSAPSDAAQ